MEKLFKKSRVSRRFTTKRVRGIKSKIQKNRQGKNLKRISRRFHAKDFDMNYYLEPKIDFLLSEEENNLNRLRRREDSEFNEVVSTDFEHYNKQDREIAIIGIKDMIYQILKTYDEKNKDKKSKGKLFPDTMESSAFSLFDYYLKHSEKKLSKSEVIKALYSYLIYIDKLQKINVFNKSFLNNFELNLDVLRVVDFNLYPVKVFDYFEIFLLRISQTNKDDFMHKEYIKMFKKAFIEFDFYLNFNDNSKLYRPYEKFIYCLLMTKTFLKNNNFLNDEIVDFFIEKYKSKINFNQSNYQSCVNYVKDSKYFYDNYVYFLNVNNLSKNGLVGINNLNCI